MELEFLKSGINLPEYFKATPCFHQNYDWLKKDGLDALFSIQMPFLHHLDIETVSKIKEDNRDEFMAFSRSLLNAVEGIKGSFGTAQFASEVRSIQRNQIDASLNDMRRVMKSVASMASLRKRGVLVGLLGQTQLRFSAHR